MNRYRLTFDPNPKELARRDTAGCHVALLWSRRLGRAAVVLHEDATGELVELDVRERENPLELYQHPYAYLTSRGHLGRRAPFRTRRGPAGRETTRQLKEVTTMAKKEQEKRDIKKDSRRDR
jgi:hypothetical protein